MNPNAAAEDGQFAQISLQTRPVKEQSANPHSIRSSISLTEYIKTSIFMKIFP